MPERALKWLEWASQGTVIAGSFFTILAVLFRTAGTAMVYRFMDQRYSTIDQVERARLALLALAAIDRDKLMVSAENERQRVIAAQKTLEDHIRQIHEHFDERLEELNRLAAERVSELKDDIRDDIRELRRILVRNKDTD